jgi:seryl-tRNA(Sec) selenium transferase
MKVDRQEIAGCVVALREWLAMDHEARLLTYGERIDVILAELRGLPGVEAVRVSSVETPPPVLRDGVRVRVESATRAEAVMRRLQEGEPSIWVRTYGSYINVSVGWLPDELVGLVARRLREALQA